MISEYSNQITRIWVLVTPEHFQFCLFPPAHRPKAGPGSKSKDAVGREGSLSKPFTAVLFPSVLFLWKALA